MSSASSVVVYVLSADPNGSRAQSVGKLFSAPYFETIGTEIQTPAVLPTNVVSSNLPLNQGLEAYRVNWALSHARDTEPDKYVIIAKDTSVSAATSDTVQKVVSSAINTGGWDVCYLCKWLDRCDLYNFSSAPTVGSQSTVTYDIVNTKYPNGVQAIMFSPNGIAKILGLTALPSKQSFLPLKSSLGSSLTNAITRGDLVATCIVPNLISYDMTAPGTKSTEFYKVNECAVLPPGGMPSRSATTTPGVAGVLATPGASKNVVVTTGGTSGWVWFWILVILALLFILGWYLIKKRNASKLLSEVELPEYPLSPPVGVPMELPSTQLGLPPGPFAPLYQ